MRLGIIVLCVTQCLLVEPAPCRSENKEYSSTFETVWGKVNATYFDSTFGGLSWKDVHDRYQPQVAAAERDEAFYRLMNRMLWELKVSHANVIPPGSFARYEPLAFAEGSPGIDIRLLDGAAVIVSVTPESPAFQVGLRPGYVIHAIDSVSVKQMAHDATLVMAPPDNSRARIARVTKAILSRVYGAPGTEVSIVYSDESEKKSEKKIMRTKRAGAAVGPQGTLFMAIEFEARRLDGGIGYLRLNTLLPPLAARIPSAVKSMGDLGGVILDLRGNSGGEIEGMPDLFLTERTLLYLKTTRSGESKVFFDPVTAAFKGPLVVLIDPLSGSASELFAASMQAAGRATVVGDRSPGSTTESDVMIFPSGAVFMYPVAQLATPDSTVLEGHGVVPDIEVELNRAMLLRGVDSQLDSAIRYLEGEMQK